MRPRHRDLLALTLVSTALWVGACTGYTTGSAGTTVQRVPGFGGGKPAPTEAGAPSTGGPRSASEVFGAAWSRALTRTQFAPRDGHASAVFAGKLWVLGGWNTGPLADVWSSEDGVRWDEVVAGAPWAARRGHAAAVLGGKLWIFGGTVGAEQVADIWSSPDGKSWERVTDAAPWGARTEHAVVVHGETLYLLGGWGGSDRSDVWATGDGRSWQRLVEKAPWSARNSFAAASFGGKLWLTGGWGRRPDGADGNLADAWSSPDGIRWTASEGQPPWSPRNGHTLAVLDGRLWLLGGWADKPGEPGNVNDVWSTANGERWQIVTAQAPWLARNGHTAEAFQDQLWVLAGWSHLIGGTSVNDLWRTTGR